MAMTQLKPPGTTRQQTSLTAPSDNFAKALLEAGGHVVDSTINNGVGMVGDALGSLFGVNTTAQNPNEPFSQSQSGFAPEMRAQQELQEQEWKKREAQILRHREVQQTEVFDHRKVEEQQLIKSLLEQLDHLSKELSQAEQAARDARIAVIQCVTADGAKDYYKIFFERFIKIVVLLRQKVGESTTWLAQFNSRQSAKKGYWGMFAQHGTTWAMSGERSIATSVG